MSRYLISKGYRLVLPYLHTSNLKVKQDGMSISEIVQLNYPSQDSAKVESAINGGRVLCNGNPVQSLSECVSKGDILSYTQHRHEPEVLATPLDVLHTCEDLVVVNKPSSIPVHPVGTFRMNSVLKILKHEHSTLLGGRTLYVSHRIDRLASGVLILATSPKKVVQLNKQFAKRSVEKEYIARVKGTFPEGLVEVNKPIASKLEYPITCYTSPDGWSGQVRLHADSRHRVLVGCKFAGKPSRTVFERESVSPDGSESIVRCRPVTGRTHQIRVHLKWLGHPITNDYKYGGDLASSCCPDPVPELEGLYTKMEWCPECTRGERDTGHVTSQDLNATTIWLHALRYTSTNIKHQWTFQAPFPGWSQF